MVEWYTANCLLIMAEVRCEMGEANSTSHLMKKLSVAMQRGHVAVILACIRPKTSFILLVCLFIKNIIFLQVIIIFINYYKFA